MERNLTNLTGDLVYQAALGLPAFAECAYKVHDADKTKNPYLREGKKAVAYMRVAPAAIPVLQSAVNLVEFCPEELIKLIRAAWEQAQQWLTPVPVQAQVPIGVEWFTGQTAQVPVPVRRIQKKTW
jgi:hypothetical protein